MRRRSGFVVRGAYAVGAAALLLFAGCNRRGSVEDPNVCRNNLRLINNAKHHWALEHRASARATPTEAALAPYINGGFEALRCPEDGQYSINPMHAVPTCSVEGHVLPLDASGGAAPVEDALEGR